MQDFFAALIAFFLLEPLQQQVDDTLSATRVPQEMAIAVASCAREHGAQIIDRALNDPWWAVSKSFGVWTGLADPSAILIEAAPNCAPAVQAAQPFLAPNQEPGS